MKVCNTIEEQVKWIKRVFTRIKNSWSVKYNWSDEKRRLIGIRLIDRLEILKTKLQNN